MSKFIQNMNDQQKEAITTTEGPLMIIAGAGSGKTRVITNRIAYLISEKNILESNILAITFTNKAAKEMKERIFELVGSSASYIWINTFHSMCVKILRNHIDLIGYSKNFTILDTSEQKSIIKNILKNLNYSEEDFEPSSILKIISSSKNDNIRPGDMAQQVRFGFMKTVSEVYFEYEKYLHKNSVLDFDDLIIKVLDIFDKYPNILNSYQEKFQYIHVDEYQDTNIIQYRLINLLANKHKNICIVGDDDQSIYSWRGACIDNIKKFEKDFKNTKIIFLNQNYRSNSTILEAANTLIKNNSDRKDKNLWSSNISNEKINLYAASNDIDEAEYIAKSIKKLNHQGIDYKDIAILYRANYLSRNIENALLQQSIPYKLIGSLKFLQRQEIKDILSYVNVIVNHQDELSLRRIINVPKRGVGAVAIEKIENYMQANNMTMFEALSEIQNIKLNKKTTDQLSELYNLITSFSNFEAFTIDNIIKDIYIKSGYEAMLKNSMDAYSESRIENIWELIASAKQYVEHNISLVDYITDMSLTSDADDENSDNSVTLSTLHASKGLEYNTVFIIGLEENVFPSIREANSIEDELLKMEEERRLAYVGITRAKEKLFLSYSNKRMLFGNVKYNDKSRFIKELPTHLIKEEKSSVLNMIENHSESNHKNFISKLSPKIKEKKHTKSENAYAINERVYHGKFGSGKVVAINSDSITINFFESGEKTLLLEYVKLTKE